MPVESAGILTTLSCPSNSGDCVISCPSGRNVIFALAAGSTAKVTSIRVESPATWIVIDSSVGRTMPLNTPSGFVKPSEPVNVT